MLPALPEYSNPRSDVKFRRYQTSRTQPSVQTKPDVPQMQPYQEKEMVNKLHNSLQRIARPVSFVPYPYPISSPSGYLQVNYTNGTDYSNNSIVTDKVAQFQYNDEYQSKKHFGNDGPLKIVNNQYNSPIGLYSSNNIGEELKKQVG